MKTKVKLASIFVAAFLLVFVFLSLPAFARPAHAPQDQATAETQSVEKGKKQKDERGSGKEIGKSGEDVGKARARVRRAWAKALPEPPAISLPCTLAKPPPISARAPGAPARTSESVPEKARPRSAKEAPRE